jgi:hypothetical protein
VVDGKAYCLDLTRSPSPLFIDNLVARMSGRDGVVCAITLESAGMCADASAFSSDVRGARLVDSVRSIAGVSGGRWCASLLRGGVRCGRIETLAEPALAPAAPRGLPDTVRFVEAFGGQVSCARAERGEVWCWGEPRFGELGRADARDSSAAPIAGGRTYRSLVAEDGTWCGVVSDGSVRCWGDGRGGMIGDSTTLDRCLTGYGDPFPCARTPRLVPLPGPARQFALTRAGKCALLVGGRVVCWGSRFHQAIAAVEGLPGEVTDVAVGGQYGCARTATGGLWCWSLTGTERSPERIRAP